jgi:uncharacterized protein
MKLKQMPRRGWLAAIIGVVGLAATARAQGLFDKQIFHHVTRGDAEAVRRDLLKGENPNQADERRTPLLITAVLKGHLAIVEMLLKAGAVVDGIDADHRTALMWAAERDDIDAAQLLLSRNPRVNLQDRQGVTALIAAARRGSAEVVRALLAKKANPNIADFTGRTALSYAVRNNRHAIASLLRAAGGKE